MFETMLIMYTLYIIIKIYISVEEIKFIASRKDGKAIILSEKNFKEAGNYKIEIGKISIVSSLYDLLIFFAWIGFGFKALGDLINFDNGMINTIAFVLVFIIVNFILELPFSLYQTFNVDKRYGFSTIRIKTYLLDQAKAANMFFVFIPLFVWMLASIIESFENWWIYGFGAIFIIILFINMIYPTLIAPIFNKFSSLDDKDLQGEIENLLDNAGLKSSGVYTIDASKRDKRLNAYFGGLGKSKRVVLFDTLIKKLDKKEILAVLGHELGHFKHGDILKNIGASALVMFSMFAFFGNIPDSIFTGIGLEKSSHMILIMFLLLSPVFSFIMMPFFGLLSRRNEFAADKYGSECVSKEALASALTKLAEENKSFPLSHYLTVIFYYTHPALTERLEKLGVNDN